MFTEFSNAYFNLLVAFAELQTEVSDFTSDLNLIGIPFWDYTNFTYKVLFPTDSACSAVLSDVRVCFPTY